MAQIESKYKFFFKYLTGEDVDNIVNETMVSESTIRKYLNNEYPKTELGKAKFDKIVECCVNILKTKSEIPPESRLSV